MITLSGIESIHDGLTWVALAGFGNKPSFPAGLPTVIPFLGELKATQVASLLLLLAVTR